MLGRPRSYRKPAVRQRVRLPPVELRNAFRPHAPRFEMGADSEGRDERHIELGQLADGRKIEVVVVIVRHDHKVQWRQRSQRNRNGLEPLRSDEP